MTDPLIQKIDNLLRKWWVLAGAGIVASVPVVLLIWWAFPYYQNVLSDPFWFRVVVMAVLMGLILQSTAICILAERKIAGFTQDRHGPNRVGFWGLLQPVADGMKFFLKEDIIPSKVDKPIFLIAPCIALVTSMIGFAIIPWAGEIHWPWMAAGETVSTQVAPLNVGFLYLLAVGSIGVYGVVLAGYASNNKYSFYGGMRATAQMISYELPMGLALIVMLLVSGTLRLDEMVNQQAQSGVWFIFLHPIAFFLLLVSAFAETNRTPFDLAEAEQELVGGFHTEYSSMKFALFFLGEYAHMITNSALLVAVFLGGWAPLPFTSALAENTAPWAAAIKFGVYLGKVALFIGLFMIIRWTIPRFRFDQLMRLAWKSMIPVGIVLLVGVAILTAFGLQRNIVFSLVLNVVLLAILWWQAATTKQSVTGRQEDLPQIEVRPA